MANENGSSNTAIVAIVVIAVIIIGAMIYYWGGFRDKGSVNQTNIESPMQAPGRGDSPLRGTGAEQTQRSPGRT